MKKRSYELELMDDLELSSDDLRKNLDELEIVNTWLGGYKPIFDALKKITKKHNLTSFSIADIGAGGGDTIRKILKLAKQKKWRIKTYYVDANQFMIDYAKEKCKNEENIEYIKENIFSEDFKKYNFDISICSLFCHHFSEEDLVKMFVQLKKQTKIAIIINDLHRNIFAYYGIYFLTRLFNGSYLIKNDAPLSVKRAFLKEDLALILQKAEITNYKIRWRWAFRWQVIIDLKV